MAKPLPALAARGREDSDAMSLPALMYHDIVEPGHADDSGFPGAAAAHYKLTTSAFEQHLSQLAATRYRFPCVSSLRDASQPCCLLTFDDGGVSALRVAGELASHGISWAAIPTRIPSIFPASMT